jgi:4-carboxymuconolactone decarboxylase
MTTHTRQASPSLRELDDRTAALVRVAAVVTAGSEVEIRAVLGDASRAVPHIWIEELLLQTYLFAGFPRALNAFREWRRFVPAARPGESEDEVVHVISIPNVEACLKAGAETCRAVYGSMYNKLCDNVEALHPDLASWMIIEGYGKVLSRAGLDLPRRELCIVAACAASGQDRQLHSHLHGALNVGASRKVVSDALDALSSVIPTARLESARLLFAKVAGK